MKENERQASQSCFYSVIAPNLRVSNEMIGFGGLCLDTGMLSASPDRWRPRLVRKEEPQLIARPYRLPTTLGRTIQQRSPRGINAIMK